MLFYDDPPLLLVKLLDALARPKLDVEIGHSLIEYGSLELWFDLCLPDIQRIGVEVLGKSSGDDYSALELSSRFRRYSQAAFVIELSFKVVQQGFPSLMLGLVD